MPSRCLVLAALLCVPMMACNRGPLGGDEPIGWGTGWETGDASDAAGDFGEDGPTGVTVGDDGAVTTFGDDDGAITTIGDDDGGVTTIGEDDGASFISDDDGASFIGDDDGASFVGDLDDDGASFVGDDDGASFIGDDGGGDGGPIDPCPWMDRLDWDAPVDVVFAAEPFPELTAGSCSDVSNPAAAIRWEVQETSEYNIDITSSNGPATFHLVRGDCGEGNEIICGEASEPVLRALDECDLVVLGPSNPYVSIDPILELAGVRERLLRKPVVALSPIVGGKAVKGPLGTMIPQLTGEPASARAIASHYGELLNGMVVEGGDGEGLGLPCLETRTVMRDEEDRARLAAELLRFALTLG